MIIHADSIDLYEALFQVNTLFKGNIVFRTLEYIGKDKQGNTKHRVTLTVQDSHKAGSSRNPRTGRLVSAACWHVHGYFMDALPQGTKIHSRGETIYSDAWKDWNAGSIMFPVLASEKCYCKENNYDRVLGSRKP